MATYWQIAAGDIGQGRDYSEDFIRHGIAFLAGEQQLQRLQTVKQGDVIVLKRGKREALAVGRIVERDGKTGGYGDKYWLSDFDGWDLQGYVFVEWRRMPKQTKLPGELSRGTIMRINNPEIAALAEKILATTPPEPVLPEPAVADKLTDTEIISFLVKEGLRPSAAAELTETFNRIRYLVEYYHAEITHGDIKEHETRTFLVAPLLLALGWSEQQLKIEYATGDGLRADIACFLKPYRTGSEDCQIIIETKGFRHGLDVASDQARQYTARFPSCKTLIATNGYCYKMFQKEGGEFQLKEPVAYLNLRNPLKSYPRLPRDNNGGLRALQLMMPSAYY
jgi:hypothetical protein